MKKLMIALLLGMTVLSGCDMSYTASPTPIKNEMQKANEIQNKIVNNVPIPQLTNSVERNMVAERAKRFDVPNKIGYVYLMSFGKVLSFYPIKGKVASLRSYLVPVEKMVADDGGPCTKEWRGSDGIALNCFQVEAPDIDGTYGENVQGIFFYTTEGQYVEWNGEYLYSEEPLKIATPVELTRQVK